MHRQEVLTKYSNLVIGQVEGEKPQILVRGVGELSPVPYAEPMWLAPLMRSPYYDDSHRALQHEARKYVDNFLHAEALRIEESGERPSKEIIQSMAYVPPASAFVCTK